MNCLNIRFRIVFFILCIVPVLCLPCFCQAGNYDRYGLYGVGHPAGGHLLKDPPGYEDMVWRRIAESGATSVRQAASWREIEAVKGHYDWSQVESTLKYCRKYPQIRPYLLVVNTPGWARSDGQPSHLPPMPSAIPDFKKFCKALAERYKGSVNHYEIWNEQNGFGWEAPPFNQVDKYLPILQAAYEGLKEGNPDCVVSLGGLDDAAGNSPIFTKGSYDLLTRDYGKRRIWDAFGDHPYGDVESLKTKLRAIKGIAAGYDDGSLELWLTEYGFHTGAMSEAEQAAALSKYMMALITDPEFRYVTETNYLCVADFEDTTHGFGLCDANLRPRPAFYAYQRLPRPGRIVVSDIIVQHLSSASVRVTWKTDTPAACTLSFGPSSAKFNRDIRTDKADKEHSVILTGLEPASTYCYSIRAAAEGYPVQRSLDYDFTTLAKTGLLNAGFEEDFVVQIARHWECIGDNLCFDSARLDRPFNVVHSGKHAQCIVANNDWGDGLDDAVVSQAAAEPGKLCTFSAWTYAASDGEGEAIIRKVGIDPTGGKDSRSSEVVWSSGSRTACKWERQAVTAAAKSGVITLFVSAVTTKKDKGKDFLFVDDAELRW